MKKIPFLLILLYLIVSATSCKDDTENETLFTKDKITGYAQKGPFSNGSSVLISELDENFVQTGRNITSSIANNQGLYQIDNIEFISQYVTISANGYYFNEISGNTSSSQLTLYAISDLSDKTSLNINILSHLEKARVEYLLSTGSSFQDAKNQALQEILEIFEISMPDNMESELLDISQDGDGNAILLAISSIFQGYRSTGDLSLLLADFSTDIAPDGVLDNTAIQGGLISHAKSLNLVSIRENIENHYDEMGIGYSIPDFETHIQHFIENTDFETGELIEYPEYGEYGLNILNAENDTFVTERTYSFAANLPENTNLKIVLKNGIWMYDLGSVQNWSITEYNESENIQSFTSVLSDQNCDLLVLFPMDSLNQNDIVIEYFENNASEPTMTRSIVTIDTIRFSKY